MNDDQLTAVAELDRVIAGLAEQLERLQATRRALAGDQARSIELACEAEAEPECDDLIPAPLAARRLGVSAATIRWLCRTEGRGELRGGRWWVSEREIADRLDCRFA